MQRHPHIPADLAPAMHLLPDWLLILNSVVGPLLLL
jgi:hypothetical protein